MVIIKKTNGILSKNHASKNRGKLSNSKKSNSHFGGNTLGDFLLSSEMQTLLKKGGEISHGIKGNQSQIAKICSVAKTIVKEDKEIEKTNRKLKHEKLVKLISDSKTIAHIKTVQFCSTSELLSMKQYQLPNDKLDVVAMKKAGVLI